MDLPSPHISITIIGPIVEQDAHIGCALALRILAEFHTSQHVLTFFNKGKKWASLRKALEIVNNVSIRDCVNGDSPQEAGQHLSERASTVYFICLLVLATRD